MQEEAILIRAATRRNAAPLQRLCAAFNGTAEAMARALAEERICVASCSDGKLADFAAGLVRRSFCYAAAYGEMTEL
ncbi:MAG: hypothetical protein LBG83_06260 [Oscillospiraceae bacterium]|nr:hypothetical protein [Oscillospiraceae bacterium]